MGSNGPAKLDPLKFASIDAENLASALKSERRGFDVQLPASGSDAFSVRHQLLSSLKIAVGVPVQETEITPENHLVLMASSRLERAREFPELGGSFMTPAICDALGDWFEEADRDGDDRLSIEGLKRWLESKARQHNDAYSDRAVPYPFVLGQKKEGSTLRACACLEAV
jgi:hypothetical protein